MAFDFVNFLILFYVKYVFMIVCSFLLPGARCVCVCVWVYGVCLSATWPAFKPVESVKSHLHRVLFFFNRCFNLFPLIATTKTTTTRNEVYDIVESVSDLTLRFVCSDVIQLLKLVGNLLSIVRVI